MRFIFTSFETSVSELESPTDSISSSQSHISLSEHVQDALALLRGCLLSPFDLVLEILDKDKPGYSYHQTKFIKKGMKNYLRSSILLFQVAWAEENFELGWEVHQRPNLPNFRIIQCVLIDSSHCIYTIVFEFQHLNSLQSLERQYYDWNWPRRVQETWYDHAESLSIACTNTTKVSCPDIKDIVAVSWNSLGTIFFPEATQIARQAQNPIAAFRHCRTFRMN